MEYTEILTLIRRIVRSVNLESKRIDKEHGISIPQLLCLNYLSRRANYQASHKDIKDFLSLNASTVTGIIARLERKGLIAKLPKGDDRRVSLITLTARGSNLIQKSPVPIQERLTQRLRELSPQQLEEIQRGLSRITELLDLSPEEHVPLISADAPPSPEIGEDLD